MEKSQTQDSFLLLVYRFNISFVSLGKANVNDILQSKHIDFYRNFRHECTQVYLSYRQGRRWDTHPSRSPFSNSSLTVIYFLSIGQEKSFCLSPPYYQLLDKRDLFPWGWKRAMHTKEALERRVLCTQPASSPSSLQHQAQTPYR